ncbi:MAG: exosome complex protein Rrp42 [Candidatus Diapherotrites archaeon]|uniref:Exosome complex component Rrp42 n=1 Tax=Candidatus Iainarchaeum sp. TaxID=3101447 RepID=A0A938YXY1_9ARCH|nr:exosome complex protein Rrp42 [Candidatus Diapherotrites archaeon]
MEETIWDLRTDKTIAAIKEGKRLDGRKFDEYREVKIVNDISENADGSARVLLGKTDVIAGIKMVPGDPYPDSPDEGTISVGAELLPLASPSFESGPPREEATELARVVDRGIRESKAIDFKKLCIREGELVWIVFIDVYTMNHDGNLFDACSIAALSSLLKTKIPKLEADRVVAHEYAGKLALARKPLLSTFAKMANNVVLDPILSEEKAMEARFSCATTEDDCLCAFQKGGGGSFTESEIDNCIDVAFKKAKDIRKLL